MFIPVEKLPPVPADPEKLPPARLSAPRLVAALELPCATTGSASLYPHCLSRTTRSAHRGYGAVARAKSDQMAPLLPTATQVREGSVVARAHGRQATLGR